MATLPPDVQSSPPTAKIVWLYLDVHGPSSLDEVMDNTGCPRRSVARALSTLVTSGDVTHYIDPTDARRRLYAAT